MRRSGKRSGVDVQRVVAAAAEAFLDGDAHAGRPAEEEDHGRRRFGVGAVAVGVVAGIGARALYRRARALDLEDVARAVEQRIVN